MMSLYTGLVSIHSRFMQAGEPDRDELMFDQSQVSIHSRFMQAGERGADLSAVYEYLFQSTPALCKRENLTHSQ